MKKKLLSLFAVITMATTFGQEVYTTQNAGIALASAGVRDFSIVDAQTSWVYFYDGSGANTYPRYVGVTTNGGGAWNTRLVSAIPSTALISDIYGVSGTHGFIVTAPTGTNGTANGLWKTENGGQNWTKIQGVFGNQSFGNLIHIWPNGTGLVIGDPVNNRYEMYKTTDGGANWSTLTTAPTPLNADEYGYVGGKVIFENNIWLTSNTGRILHSADYGVTWNSYSAPIDDFAGAESNGSMSFSSATYGLLVDNFSLLWYTEDAGRNWDIKDAVNYFDGDVKHVPGTANTFVTTGISQESSLGYGTAYSHDGGSTWTQLDSGDQRGAIGVKDCATMFVGHFTSSAQGAGGILKLNSPIPGCETMGLDQVSTNKVELKAVVSNKILNVVSNKEIKEVLVVDMTGKSVAKSEAISVNVAQLTPGTYVARVAYVDGAFGTVKFVVK